MESGDNVFNKSNSIDSFLLVFWGLEIESKLSEKKVSRALFFWV
jgi:hypothetical protein